MLELNENLTLQLGDMVKLTQLYESTTLTNTGQTTVILESSEDGYSWSALVSINPDDTMALSLKNLYIRMVKGDSLSLVSVNPISRNNPDNIPFTSLALNQYALDEDLKTKADKTELQELNQQLSQAVNQKADKQTVQELQTQLQQKATTQSLEELNQEIKRVDSKQVDLSGLATKEELQAKASSQELASQVATLLERINGLNIPSLTQAVTQLQADLRAIGNIPQVNKQTLTQLTSQIQDLQSMVDGFGNTDSNQSRKLTELESSLQELTTRLSTLQSEPKVSVNDFNVLRQTVMNYRPTWDSITGKPGNLSYGNPSSAPVTYGWDAITNKPTRFDPASHRHSWEEINNVPSASTTSAGIVELVDNLTTDDNNKALTAKQGKALKDELSRRVTINGNDDIYGSKAFYGQLYTMGGIRTSASASFNNQGHYATLGANNNDAWWQFNGGGVIRIHKDGRLTFNYHTIYHANNTPTASDTTAGFTQLSHQASDDRTKAASSFALKQVKDAVDSLQRTGTNAGGTTFTGRINWNNIDNKPATFTPTSHTHTWREITDKPATFTPSSHSHGWNDITGKPSSFAPTSHNHTWDDITGKPSSFTPSSHQHQWTEIQGKPTTFTPTAHNHSWDDISNKPSEFTPSSHTHAWSQITNKPNTVQDYGITNALRTDADTTITGIITINRGDSYVKGQYNNRMTWYVGSGSSANSDVQLYNARLDTKLDLKTDRVESNKEIYVNSHKVFHTGNLPTWDNISGKPSTFTPSSHRHAWSEIDQVPQASDTVAGIVQLSHDTRGTSKTKAASEFALNELRKTIPARSTYTGTPLITVNRNRRTTTITGTGATGASRQIPVEGEIHTYNLNGKTRLVQHFLVKGFLVSWFNQESWLLADHANVNGYIVDVPLWTAMPNKITSVHIQTAKAKEDANPARNTAAFSTDAGWDIISQGTVKDSVRIVFNGNAAYSTELRFMYVVVEGY